MDLHELSLQQAHELLSSRQISSEELTRAYLERIERLDPQIKSYVTVSRDLALEQARDADQTHQGRRRFNSPDRHSLLCKGLHLDTRRHHHLLLQNPRELQTVLRLDCHQKVEVSKFRSSWQEQHGRVRHGLIHRELRFLHHAQPLEPGLCPRWLERWFGRGGRGWTGSLLAGRGHRRLGPHAGRVLRDHRAQDHLWTCLPLRLDPAGLFL